MFMPAGRRQSLNAAAARATRTLSNLKSNTPPPNMDTWLTAYVDETGTNELDSQKPGVSHLFICVAVLVDPAGLRATETAVRQLSQDLCGGAEISSSRIAGDHKRRLAFVERIQHLPFSYLALVINKDRIPPDSGLQFKRSFYKYINRMLYERLAKSGHNLRVIADQFGGQDFMDSFAPYLQDRGLPSLFLDFKHSFADSAATPLIQLADLIAGTLSYCFDPDRQGEYSPRFRELLRPLEAGIECWPWEAIPDTAADSAAAVPDELLRRTMRNRVVRFLQEHQNRSDPDRQMQAMTLSQLMFARQFEDRENQAIVSDILMARLQHAGFEELGKQAFQSRIIGKIRDEGIILAGASDGYRLALSGKDIQDYLDHDSTIIEPMLGRILKGRNSVKSDTGGLFDILDQPKYLHLRRIADTYLDSTVERAATRQNE